MEKRNVEMRDVDAEDNEAGEDGDVKEIGLLVKLRVNEKLEDEKVSVSVVYVRWLQGRNAVLFESFCGWLKRRIEDR